MKVFDCLCAALTVSVTAGALLVSTQSAAQTAGGEEQELRAYLSELAQTSDFVYERLMAEARLALMATPPATGTLHRILFSDSFRTQTLRQCNRDTTTNSGETIYEQARVAVAMEVAKSPAKECYPLAKRYFHGEEPESPDGITQNGELIRLARKVLVVGEDQTAGDTRIQLTSMDYDQGKGVLLVQHGSSRHRVDLKKRMIEGQAVWLPVSRRIVSDVIQEPALP